MIINIILLLCAIVGGAVGFIILTSETGALLKRLLKALWKSHKALSARGEVVRERWDKILSETKVDHNTPTKIQIETLINAIEDTYKYKG